MAGNQATRVLVVDYAQVMRRAVEKMLQSDYDVVLANDGEAGWEQLAQDNQIEMLITDIQIPVLDGYGLICRVRASDNAHIRDLPIITITGAEDDETRIRAYACGSTDFIIKPFDKKLLSSRVHAYLRLKRASLLHATSVAGDTRTLDPLTRLGGLGAFLEAGKGFFQNSRERGLDLSVAARMLMIFLHCSGNMLAPPISCWCASRVFLRQRSGARTSWRAWVRPNLPC